MRKISCALEKIIFNIIRKQLLSDDYKINKLWYGENKFCYLESTRRKKRTIVMHDLSGLVYNIVVVSDFWDYQKLTVFKQKLQLHPLMFLPKPQPQITLERLNARPRDGALWIDRHAESSPSADWLDTSGPHHFWFASSFFKTYSDWLSFTWVGGVM